MPSWNTLSDRLRTFVEKQPLFFVATAGASGRVNMSPKGLDSLQVLSENRILWLNVSGSGNETAAHVRENGRMTLMFCAFEGDPMILRVYGKARVIHPHHEQWRELSGHFPDYAGSRQVFDLSIELVQSSCGTGVPVMPFERSRAEEELLPFYEDMGPEGVTKYWKKKNVETIDGTPTGIFNDS